MNRAAVAIGASNKRLVGLSCLQTVEMKSSTQIINEQLSVEGGPVVAGVAIDVDRMPTGGNVAKAAEGGF